MEPAVSTVLAEVLSQPTAWDDLGDWRVLPGFQANRKPVFQAGGVPQSRRNPCLTQASGLTSIIDLLSPRYQQWYHKTKRSD
ncbi:hypothetical protein EGT51_00680 [Levilactobacillus suantsaiihabitans]|uniref:Uncharacterized protein n=1 Tax=Levilactobacillus suantsaiihabitans TaxID=2487722 RepID=A0A4Z0JFG4_9LACO|nr:hypothetical protein EGT51_00680 [Levilactobacillus suantsaiihabitans]